MYAFPAIMSILFCPYRDGCGSGALYCPSSGGGGGGCTCVACRVSYCKLAGGDSS